MASPTPNKNYTYPAHGGAVNAWDSPLNQNFDQIDQNLGGSYNITISSTTAAATYNSSFATIPSTAATITLPSTIAYNLSYNYSGTMVNAQDLAFPAVGGVYVVTNNSSGSFSLTAVVSGSTTTNVPVPQGGSNTVVSNGSGLVNADSNALAKVETYLGNPNGSVSGVAGSANGAGTDFIWDGTNRILYAAVTTGSTATTVWGPVCGKLVPEGYLSLSTDNDNPIVTADATATTLKYLPLNGNWTLLSDGTTLYPYQFSAMSLSLTASQAANIIYDVFMFYNAGTPVIGTGPAWATSTAGAGARGTGAGTTQLARFLGVWTNAVQVTLTNGASTYVCPANQGIYLGSIYMNSAAGQLSNLPNYGQSRKQGVWNTFNRQAIVLQAGDSTSSWTNNSTTVRASNGNSANSITVFQGLPEETFEVEFAQLTAASGGSGGLSFVGVGWNSTTVNIGLGAIGNLFTSAASGYAMLVSRYIRPPTIGINTITSLEASNNTITITFYGGQTGMLLTARWRG